MKRRRSEAPKKGKLFRSNLLSHVQNPDDLEIGTVVIDKARGSKEQLVNEESPDDLEVTDEQNH